MAAEELTIVCDLIHNYGIDNEPDDRIYIWDDSAQFSSSADTGACGDNAKIWSTCIPNKLKFSTMAFLQ